jgi:hypothetical protein
VTIKKPAFAQQRPVPSSNGISFHSCREKDAAAKTQEAAAEVRIITELQNAVGGKNPKLIFLHWRPKREPEKKGHSL